MDAWVVFVDAESGCQYYHNPKRQITTWDCPPELAIISAAAEEPEAETEAPAPRAAPAPAPEPLPEPLPEPEPDDPLADANVEFGTKSATFAWGDDDGGAWNDPAADEDDEAPPYEARSPEEERKLNEARVERSRSRARARALARESIVRHQRIADRDRIDDAKWSAAAPRRRGAVDPRPAPRRTVPVRDLEATPSPKSAAASSPKQRSMFASPASASPKQQTASASPKQRSALASPASATPSPRAAPPQPSHGTPPSPPRGNLERLHRQAWTTLQALEGLELRAHGAAGDAYKTADLARALRPPAAALDARSPPWRLDGGAKNPAAALFRSPTRSVDPGRRDYDASDLAAAYAYLDGMAADPRSAGPAPPRFNALCASSPEFAARIKAHARSS